MTIDKLHSICLDISSMSVQTSSRHCKHGFLLTSLFLGATEDWIFTKLSICILLFQGNSNLMQYSGITLQQKIYLYEMRP